jgi:hypothetical protein
MPPKARNRETLTALKKRASVVNAHFRKEISSRKKACADNAKRARQALLIKVPATSAGSVEQRKAILRKAIKRRTRQSNNPATNDRLARARQQEQQNITTQRRLNSRLRRLRAMKKARDAGAGAGASM